jgi:hypothetical protein
MNVEPSPGPGALCANRALMEFIERFTNCQPEPENSVLPGDIHASLLEGIEDPRHRSRRDTDAAVPHAHSAPPARLPRCRYVDCPLLESELDRVSQHIQQHQ